MHRFLSASAAALLLALPAAAPAQEVSEEVQARIMDMLAGMNCQMAPEDIEPTAEGGYELDDVICEGGNQFDIELDADLNETGRRAE